MFDTKDVFLIVKEDKTDVVYKLESDSDTQKLINSIFEEAVEELTAKTNVPFDGSYTPLEDETLSIKNFVLPDIEQLDKSVHTNLSAHGNIVKNCRF